MAVSLKDFFSNVSYVMNKNLINEIQTIIPDKVIQEIKTITKSISALKKEIDEKITNIRNITFAHKTRTGSDLYEEIIKINHHELFEYTLKNMDLISALNIQLIEVLNQFMKPVKNNT